MQEFYSNRGDLKRLTSQFFAIDQPRWPPVLIIADWRSLQLAAPCSRAVTLLRWHFPFLKHSYKKVIFVSPRFQWEAIKNCMAAKQRTDRPHLAPFYQFIFQKHRNVFICPLSSLSWSALTFAKLNRLRMGIRVCVLLWIRSQMNTPFQQNTPLWNVPFLLRTGAKTLLFGVWKARKNVIGGYFFVLFFFIYSSMGFSIKFLSWCAIADVNIRFWWLCSVIIRNGSCLICGSYWISVSNFTICKEDFKTRFLQ